MKVSEQKEGYRVWIAEPERAASHERSFGLRRLTSDADTPLWRVAWIRATGELYAADPVSDRYIILGQYHTLWEVEQAMESLLADWTIGLLEWFGLTGEEDS